jgi:ornithine cyclodeaminase
VSQSHLVGEIGEVLAGTAPGRANDAEITVYKSLGISPQDLAAASFVYRRAVETGTGTVVDLDA